MARVARLLSTLRPGRRTLRRNGIALLLTLLAGGAAASLQVSQSQALYQGGPLFALEAAAQDAILRTRDPSAYVADARNDPRRLITIVAMDEKSIAELGVFRNWPRTYHAQVVDNLLAAPPRAIVFDIGFFDPAPEDPALAEAFARARAKRPATAVVIAAAGGGVGAPGPEGDVQFGDCLCPVPLLAQNADVASANVVPDDLGTVRSMPLLTRIGGQQYPTLGLAGTLKYLRRPNLTVERPEPRSVALPGRQVPVTPDGIVRINFFGPPSDPALPNNHPFEPTPEHRQRFNTFRIVSFVDVLKGRADPSLWQNGLVFVGLLSATGFADDYWTPVSEQGRKMSGVEIHANTAATLFSSQFLREAPLSVNLALVAGLALLVGLLAANLGVVPAALAALAAMGLYVAGNWLALDQGTVVALSNPLAGGVLAFVAVTAYRVTVEQRQARALQGALASVIPPSVAQAIARDPDRVAMGGERRAISVLFTDLKGFTTFSEAVDPVVLSRIITEYLEAMTAVVFRHGGTVDKFIGDAVMAFWNAPLDDPEHARHACEAALDMQAALRQLSDRWQAEGYPRQYMRVGLNTGYASVGNMGTRQRFAYTALGDTVNLGARLEPLNNEYGTWICLSQATLDAAGGQERFLVRFLDLVAVKGKKEPVPVYELIGRTSDAELVERYRPVLEPYHQGIVLYQQRQFAEAAVYFRSAQVAGGPGGDPPSTLYLERCEALAAEPPVADWDGVFVQKHK